MNVRAPLIPNLQTSKTSQPRQGSFDHPPMSPEPFARFDAPAGNPREDPALAQGLTQTREVVGFVGVQFSRPSTRMSDLSANGPDCIDGRGQQAHVMHICRRLDYRQRDALSIDHNMALRARFAAVHRVRPGVFAPPGAGTLAESSEARSQSIWPAALSRLSNSWCNRSQTPAFCQSRKRRQQVMPEPQPISWGSISQGMPLLSTNKMPVSAARLSTRGRPPFGFSGSGGSKGSIIAHSSLVTSGLARD